MIFTGVTDLRHTTRMFESQPRPSRKLFWIIFLILLLVIVGLVLPVPRPIGHPDPATRPEHAIREIRVGIGHYRTEYNGWPEDPALAKADSVPAKLRGRVLDQLMGRNPRSIEFVELKDAKPGRSGLAMEDGARAWHDPWGTCYFIMLDLMLQNQIPNPEHLAGAVTPSPILSRTPKYLPAYAIVFSAGPDRDPNTWADNICSWR